MSKETKGNENLDEHYAEAEIPESGETGTAASAGDGSAGRKDVEVKFAPKYSEDKMELADQTLKAKLSKWAFLTALTGTVLTVGMVLLLGSVQTPALYFAAHSIVPVGLTLVGTSIGLLIASFDVPTAIRKPAGAAGVLGWLAFCFSPAFTIDPRIQWGLFAVAVIGLVLSLSANGKTTPEGKENLVELFGLDGSGD